MKRAFERHAQRMLGTTNELLLQSKLIIWCYEPEKMPAMIDLLIAEGRLSESDRPHCVHWTTVEGAARLSPEGIGKVVDADEMLQAAGIRTLMAEGWEALTQGPDAFKAFWQDRCGEPCPETRDVLEKLEQSAQKWRPRERPAATTIGAGWLYSACK
jgi:hypothetical protein